MLQNEAAAMYCFKNFWGRFPPYPPTITVPTHSFWSSYAPEYNDLVQLAETSFFEKAIPVFYCF